MVATNTPPEPDSLESVKLIYPESTEATIVASGAVEKACEALKAYKAKIKELEDQSEALEVAIRGYMTDRSTLTDLAGRTLATWRTAKSSSKFDAKLFQQAMPDIYEKFVVETPGSRRFLLK